jgi:hypothetical protein
VSRDHIDDALWNACTVGELELMRTQVSSVPTGQRKHTSARASAEKGVSAAGLITVVQPAARAAPILRVIIAQGKFHGVSIDLLK